MKVRLEIAVEHTPREIRRRELLKRRIRRKLPGAAMTVLYTVAALAGVALIVCIAAVDSVDYVPAVKGALGSLMVLGLCAAGIQVLEEI